MKSGAMTSSSSSSYRLVPPKVRHVRTTAIFGISYIGAVQYPRHRSMLHAISQLMLATLSVATLARRLVAIGQAHTVRGFPNPTTTDLVRLTMRGIRRTYGVPQRRAAALTTDDILSITSLLGNALVDLRDRALLLVGFAGAFRRSELVAIDYDSVRRVVHGLLITIPRSKSDQEGRGRDSRHSVRT